MALVSSLESSLYYYFCEAEPATLLMMSHYLMILWVLCWPSECYPLFTALKQYLSLSLKHKGLLIVLPGTWLETTTCACHKGWKGFIPDPQKRLVIRKKRNTCLCNYAHLTFRKKLNVTDEMRFNKHNFWVFFTGCSSLNFRPTYSLTHMTFIHSGNSYFAILCKQLRQRCGLFD